MTMVLIVQLFKIHFQKVMAQMKKNVDRLSLPKLKPIQRRGWCVFGNLLNGMVNIGIMSYG
jgi:hypothetical protein